MRCPWYPGRLEPDQLAAAVGLGGGDSDSGGFGGVAQADAGGTVLQDAVHELPGLEQEGLFEALVEPAQALVKLAVLVTDLHVMGAWRAADDE